MPSRLKHRIYSRRPDACADLAWATAAAWARLAGPTTWRLKRHALAWLASGIPPAPAGGTPRVAVHSLVCKRDLRMALFSAKSLLLAAQEPIRWVYHDDGSLSADDCARLERHLSHAKVIRRPESDARAEAALRDFPKLAAWRRCHAMSLKLIDVSLWAEDERVVYLDTDVLFLRRPDLLLDGEAGRSPSYFNRDVASVYAPSDVDLLAEEFGVALLPEINAGVWAMDQTELRLERLERWIASDLFQPRLSDPLVEQTLVALLASVAHHGAHHLPPEYDLRFERPIEACVCRHYAGPFRHGFALEGMAHLLLEQRFAARWRVWAEGPLRSPVRGDNFRG